LLAARERLAPRDQLQLPSHRSPLRLPLVGLPAHDQLCALPDPRGTHWLWGRRQGWDEHSPGVARRCTSADRRARGRSRPFPPPESFSPSPGGQSHTPGRGTTYLPPRPKAVRLKARSGCRRVGESRGREALAPPAPGLAATRLTPRRIAIRVHAGSSPGCQPIRLELAVNSSEVSSAPFTDASEVHAGRSATVVIRVPKPFPAPDEAFAAVFSAARLRSSVAKVRIR
jgi:hypothetical protein